MAALNMMSINVILSSFLLFSFVECTETMMNDNNKNNGNNVIATDANDGNNPHNFMWDNWEHHKNLNLHLPSSGTCLTESNIDSCKLFKSCSWHDETSKCYLSADPDEIYKPIPMNMNSNQRILQELTFPENGCASIRNQGMCTYYTGCYWVRSAGCFTVRTPKPSSGSPTRAPSKKSYPPDGACSSAKSKLSCNLYSRCIWDVSTSGTPFCRQVRAGEIGGGDTPSRSPTSRPVPANPTPYPTYPNATPRPSRHPVNTPTRKQGTAKPTKGTITCAFPDNGCSSIRDGAASCVSFEGCAWSATKRACVTQKACTGNHSPSSTPKPTIPRQDTPTVDQMCQVPSGGCRNAAARDCGKYTGCYVFGGFCTERTCDKFDCGIRKLGFDFAAKILPRCQAKVSPNVGMDDCISELKDIHDGLELNARCGLKFNEGNHQTNGISKVPNLPLKRYYVSTTGDDGRGDGSFSKPYKTIQKALEVSRNSPSTPRAIILRAGTHYITETIVLTPQDSKLTIAPYENEKVTVSGAIPLEGIEWKHYNTKILVADVSQYSSKLGHLSQIFFDNIPATRARHPNADPWTQGLFTKKNTGYFDDAESWTSAIDNGPSSVVIKQDIRTQSSRYSKFSLGYGGNCGIFTPPASYWAVRNPVAGGGCMFEVPRGVTVRPSHLAGIPTPFRRVSDAYIHAYHVYLWGNWIFRVGGQNGRTFNFQGGGFQEARGSCGKGGQQYYIENMLELLDAKNEFYLDTLEKKLYYYPNATASDPAKIPNAFATVNRRIFHIAGDSTNPVKDVTIAGLKIEKTYATWMDPHEVPSAGDWSVTRNAAIFIEGGENISVYGNSFYYMGGNGVFVSNYARNVKITANRFKYLAQSAILVVGDHRYNTANPWEMLDPNHPFDTVVDGNIASEIGNVVKQSAGFFQALARGSIVQNNVFFNSERTAVNFNDGYGGDNKVYSNLMFNTVRSTIDHGPFNSWDRQAYIQSHPGSNFQPVSEPMMSYVKGNYLLGGYGGIKGIDHDDGTTWWENSNNLLVYTYQKLKGRNQESYNNLVMFPVDYAVFLSEPIGVGSSKLAWHDNTVVTGFGSDPYGFGSEDLCLRQNFQADNNEVWVQTQFWARCTPSTPRTWDEWKSERNQDKTSTVRKYLPTNLQMVKWGYDKLGLDSSLVN